MILSYDIGTTTLKIALIDEKGNFYNYKVQKLLTNISDKKAECNSGDYLTFLSLYLKEIDTNLIEAISISGNGPSIVAILDEPEINESLIKVKAYPTRTWLDKRGASKSSIVSEYQGEYIDSSFLIPSVLAMREDDKAMFDNTKSFLSTDGFVNFALTGVKATVNTPKGLMKYYYDDKLLEHFNLPKSKFPKIVDSGIVLSTISEEIANEFNIRKDIPVITGGVDFYVNILGSRASKVGVICDRTGTSEGLNLCNDRPINIKGMLIYEHPIKNYWNISGIISTTGAAIDWARNILNMNDQSYNDFYKLASAGKDDSDLLFLPYLNGERAPIWDSKAKGVIFGMNLETSRAEIAEAVVRGTCLAIKDVIKTMEAYGAIINEINAANSHTLNNYYLQLKSDITGKKINIIESKSPELLGLAMISYTNLGRYKNLIEAIEAMSKVSITYIPNFENFEKYEKMYDRYKKLYSVLKTEFNT
ncbi:MAG: hypothetical protein JJE21_03340 [Spirochaetaceae bacterium]|nr:hypothetical protein [Spirochaetaceae bacterium]